MKQSATLFGIILLTISLAFISCEKEDSNTNKVTIENMKFSPSTITVEAGTTVTWTNDDTVEHEVTSVTGLFESGDLSDGSSYSYTFSTPGTYYYKCKYHSGMNGSVIVQ